MYIFDVDGTLTPSRQVIDKKFAVWFKNNIKNYCLVTGSDAPKTIEQVGKTIWSNAEYAFNCNGNDVYNKGEHIYTNDWKLPNDAEEWLREELELSKFPLRTGLHIEDRPGMVNFSVVGRNATLGERKLYVEYDKLHEEREHLARLFMQNFPNLNATVGGETGIDIAPIGCDKSQILNFLLDKDYDNFQFYGDRMDRDGNDYPLAKILLDKGLGRCYHIKNYNETWDILSLEIIGDDK